MDGPVALVEVLRAVGADVPLRADELSARRAHALEARAAGGTEEVVVLHALAAGRAHDALLGLREEALLRELPLVGLAEGLLRPHDQIQEETEDPRTDDEQPGEVRENAVFGPLLRVAHRPEHRREIEAEDVQARATHPELHDRVVDERGPKTTKIRHASRPPLVAAARGERARASTREGPQGSARRGSRAPSPWRDGTWPCRPRGSGRPTGEAARDPPACGSSPSSARAGCRASRGWTSTFHARGCIPRRARPSPARASTPGPCRGRRSSRACS